MRGGHLGHLEGVGEPGALVVVGEDEDLGLAGQPAEGGRVQDAVAVALEAGAQRVGPSSTARRPAPDGGWRPRRAPSPRPPRAPPGRERSTAPTVGSPLGVGQADRLAAVAGHRGGPGAGPARCARRTVTRRPGHARRVPTAGGSDVRSGPRFTPHWSECRSDRISAPERLAAVAATRARRHRGRAGLRRPRRPGGAGSCEAPLRLRDHRRRASGRGGRAWHRRLAGRSRSNTVEESFCQYVIGAGAELMRRRRRRGPDARRPTRSVHERWACSAWAGVPGPLRIGPRARHLLRGRHPSRRHWSDARRRGARRALDRRLLREARSCGPAWPRPTPPP